MMRMKKYGYGAVGDGFTDRLFGSVSGNIDMFETLRMLSGLFMY